MQQAKSAYYSDIISGNSQDQRSVWKAFNQILHLWPTIPLPECLLLGQLASSFGSFFVSKINSMEDEIRRIIRPTPNKSQRS